MLTFNTLGIKFQEKLESKLFYEKKFVKVPRFLSRQLISETLFRYDFFFL